MRRRRVADFVDLRKIVITSLLVEAFGALLLRSQMVCQAAMALERLLISAKRLNHPLKIVNGLRAVLAARASRVCLLLLLNLVEQFCVEIRYLISLGTLLGLVLLITFIAPVVSSARLLPARAT